MLLGTDVPILRELVNKTKSWLEENPIGEALAVTTRAQAPSLAEEARHIEHKEVAAGVQPHPIIGAEEEKPQEVEPITLPLGSEFYEELFTKERLKKKASRSQKRKARRQFILARNVKNGSQLPEDVSPTEFKELQDADITLEEICKAANGEKSTAGSGFYRRYRVLYSQWTPPGRDDIVEPIEQLLLPLPCRRAVPIRYPTC